jgi:hypothetical protein
VPGLLTFVTVFLMALVTGVSSSHGRLTGGVLVWVTFERQITPLDAEGDPFRWASLN